MIPTQKKMRNTKTDVTTFSFCFVKKGYNQTTPENKTIITQVDYEKCDPGFIKNKIDSGNHKVYFFIKMAEKKKTVPFTPVLNSLAFQRLMEKLHTSLFFLVLLFYRISTCHFTYETHGTHEARDGNICPVVPFIRPLGKAGKSIWRIIYCAVEKCNSVRKQHIIGLL